MIILNGSWRKMMKFLKHLGQTMMKKESRIGKNGENQEKIIFNLPKETAEIIKQHILPPEKASSLFPQWYKDMPKYNGKAKKMSTVNGWHNLTVKNCMPFLDSMTNGYILKTWCDITVKRNKNGEIEISHGEYENIVKSWNIPLIYGGKGFKSHIPTMSGFEPFDYVLSMYWRIKTPLGYSCLITNPFNRTDSPFFTLTGIIETDLWHGTEVVNTALKKDFEGVIPKGTPYLQIIPFKRVDWQSEVVLEINENYENIRNESIKYRSESKYGYYRDKIWKKKNY
jgi:hypothetical protein